MAIAFRSSSFLSGNSGTSAGPSEPAGATSGDVLVAIALLENTSSGLTRPTGWTNLYNGTAPSGFIYDISYIVRGASAPSLTWTWTTSSTYYEFHVLCISGVDGTTPIDAQATLASGTGARDSAINPPAINVATANALAIAIAGHWAGSGGSGWTAPANYTLRSNNTSGNDAMMATRALTGTGSEDPGAFSTAGTTSDAWIATTIALKPADGGSTAVTRLPGTGTLAFTGLLPDRTTGGGTSPTPSPGRGALRYTGLTPARSLGVVIGPSLGSLAFTGQYVASAFQGPGVGQLRFTGLAPSLPSRFANVGRGSLRFTGLLANPTSTTPGMPTPDLGALRFTGYAPSLPSRFVNMPLGGLTFGGLRPVRLNSGESTVTHRGKRGRGRDRSRGRTA